MKQKTENLINYLLWSESQRRFVIVAARSYAAARRSV